MFDGRVFFKKRKEKRGVAFEQRKIGSAKRGTLSDKPNIGI